MRVFLLFLLGISVLFSLLLIPHRGVRKSPSVKSEWRVDTLGKKSDSVWSWRNY